MTFIQNLSLTDPSPNVLRAIADAIEADRVVVVQGTFAPRVTTSTTHAVGPVVNFTAVPEAVVAAVNGIPVSTTQDNPMGNESTVFAAPKRRGRPPKSQGPTQFVSGPDESTDHIARGELEEIAPGETLVVATMPMDIVNNTNQTIRVIAPIVPDTAAMHKALEAYVGAFKIAGAKALLSREGVAKLGELSDERKAVVVQEMRDAVASGVPAVAV